MPVRMNIRVFNIHDQSEVKFNSHLSNREEMVTVFWRSLNPRSMFCCMTVVWRRNCLRKKQCRRRLRTVMSDFKESDYGLDNRAIGVRSPAGAKDFSSSLCVQTGSGAHPASCTMGTGGPFPGGKARPGRDANHSPPSSAEVVNE
jgi:hypothetical protein